MEKRDVGLAAHLAFSPPTRGNASRLIPLRASNSSTNASSLPIRRPIDSSTRSRRFSSTIAVEIQPTETSTPSNKIVTYNRAPPAKTTSIYVAPETPTPVYVAPVKTSTYTPPAPEPTPVYVEPYVAPYVAPEPKYVTPEPKYAPAPPAPAYVAPTSNSNVVTGGKGTYVS